MFWLAGNHLKPANQHARTKCFCLHLEHLNAAELPHVNQREIEKKREWWEAQKTKTSFFTGCLTETLKNTIAPFLTTDFLHNINYIIYNLNPQIINIETQAGATESEREVKPALRAEVLTDNDSGGLHTDRILKYRFWIMPLRAWHVEPCWSHNGCIYQQPEGSRWWWNNWRK